MLRPSWRTRAEHAVEQRLISTSLFIAAMRASLTQVHRALRIEAELVAMESAGAKQRLAFRIAAYHVAEGRLMQAVIRMSQAIDLLESRPPRERTA